jgi:membrane-bound metal-dependent hydrolase YbcI (DUF457 family)
MIAGHFGFAALVKSREQRAPLWALMLSTVWLDILFVPLLLGGIETLQPVPGLRGGYGENIIHADYTHSLVGALALSALFGFLCALRWGKRCGTVLGLVAFSHWILDLLMHRHDMPLLPGHWGQFPKFGFGLWQNRSGSILAELLLILSGAWFYWRAARSVTASAHVAQVRATATGLLILVGGIAVLALDVTGILG